MKFFETSKYHSFKKSTYITLRWIGIIGQLIAVNFVYVFLNSNFDFITSNIVILLGVITPLFNIFLREEDIRVVLDSLEKSLVLGSIHCVAGKARCYGYFGSRQVVVLHGSIPYLRLGLSCFTSKN